MMTPAWKNAEEWHDDNELAHIKVEEYSNCACCCVLCEEENPYYEAMISEMRGIAGASEA